MAGSGVTKRYHAMAIRCAKLAAQGWTHRAIADMVQKKPEQIKGLIVLGERLQCAPPKKTLGGDVNKYTLYWLTGDRQVVTGPDPAIAMTMAGIGGGALGALDFYASGDDHSYEWDKVKRKWMPLPSPPKT